MSKTYTIDADSRHALEARPFAGREITIRAYAKAAPSAKLSQLVCLRIQPDHARALIAELTAALTILDQVSAESTAAAHAIMEAQDAAGVLPPSGCVLCGVPECIGGSEGQGCTSVPTGRVRGFGL